MKNTIKVFIILAVVIFIAFIIYSEPNNEMSVDDKLYENNDSILGTDDSTFSNIDGEMLQYPASNTLYEYNVYQTYVEITKYKGNVTDVVIPEELDSLPVKVIGCGAFARRDDSFAITSVVLPNNLVEISEQAFSGSALKSLVIPDSVIRIESSAFECCYFLSDVRFGKNLEVIAEYAFSGVPLQGNIELPGSLLSIETYAFSYPLMYKEVYQVADSGETINGIDYYPSDSEAAEAIRNGQTYVYEFHVHEGKKKKDTTNARIYNVDIQYATITIPATVTGIQEYAFIPEYNLRVAKGSAGVQYVVDNEHSNYELY